jgi:hypothetical protein
MICGMVGLGRRLAKNVGGGLGCNPKYVERSENKINYTIAKTNDTVKEVLLRKDMLLVQSVRRDVAAGP